MQSATILKNIKNPIKLADAPPDVVKAVQRSLVQVDLLDGSVDGIVGPLTHKAFATFKKLEYLQHLELLGPTTAIALLEATENHPIPQDNYKPEPGEKKARLPMVGLISSKQPIYPNSRWQWEDATKNLSRLPTTDLEVQNIIKLARHMDKACDFLDIEGAIVTSWLRPLNINRSVGGATQSRHVQGDGIDFLVLGQHPYDTYARLDQWHGSAGGLGKSSQFVHLDGRGIGHSRGIRARWIYGN